MFQFADLILNIVLQGNVGGKHNIIRICKNEIVHVWFDLSICYHVSKSWHIACVQDHNMLVQSWLVSSHRNYISYSHLHDPFWYCFLRCIVVWSNGLLWWWYENMMTIKRFKITWQACQIIRTFTGTEKNVTQKSQTHRNNWPVKLYFGGKIIKRQMGNFWFKEIYCNPLPRKGVFYYQLLYAVKYFQIIRRITHILPDRLQLT